MQSERDGLVPIGEALADQVHQLVGASGADPDRGFMARMMALCSLPRSNPGNRKESKHVNGPYSSTWSPVAATSSPSATCPAC